MYMCDAFTHAQLVLFEQNGYVNALVYIAMSFALAASGYLSDLMETKQILSRTVSRKLFECFALVGPAIAMLFIPYFRDNKTVIIALLTLAMTLYGCYGGGDNPVVVDIAPDFSGSVYGLTCAISSIPGFVAPLFVGFILDMEVSRLQEPSPQDILRTKSVCSRESN